MKKNKFVIAIVLIALLSAFFGAGGIKPALAEATTLAEVAGLIAWNYVGVTITPADFISGFSTVEYQTNDLVYGTVDIPIYVDEYNVQVLVDSSGYILAFYPNTDPAAKMIDVIAKNLNTTLLEYAVVMVGAAGGVTVPDVTYYDFRNLDATNMLVLAETKADGERAFSLQMPSTGDYVYYDKSYSFYQTYLPEFTLNGVNFVLDNADFVGPGYYGSIFGHFSSEIIDLVPEVLNAFTVNSGSTSAFGALVLTYSYTQVGTPEIVGADLMAEFTLVAPGDMGLATFDTLPGTVNKSAPSDGATGQLLNPTLDWSDSTSPNYEYCIDMVDNDACDTAWVSTPTAVSQAALSGLFFDTTYYWQVRAFNSAGTVFANDDNDPETSDWWSFTTEEIKAPEAFIKISPLDATTELSPNSVILEWEPTYGAYSYEYCVTEAQSCVEGDWAPVETGTSVSLTNLKFDTTYYWQVRAVNTLYSTEADSGDMWSFTTLDSFSKLTPVDGATDQKTRTILTWEKLGASTYEYCIYLDGGVPCDDDSWEDAGTATKATLRLTSGKTYFWQVRAYNGTDDPLYANAGETPEWWSFTVKAHVTPSPKVTFEKISPQDGSTDVLTSVTLKWINVGATKYEYCIDDEEVTNDTCNWKTPTDITATSITINDLSFGTKYYWQVRATIDGVLTYADKGAFWDFTTTFNKLTPDNNAQDQDVTGLTLSWEAVTGEVGYQYCLVTAVSCTEADYQSTTETSVTFDLLYGTMYYWQVRANIGTEGDPNWLYANGSPSALWRFTTEALEKFSPMDGEVDQPVIITLDWNGVTDAIEYQYCLGTDEVCTESEWTSTITDTVVTKYGLLYNTTYFWQVRANIGEIDDTEPTWLYADGSEMAFWSFTTEDMVKISPVNGASNQPIDLTLDWGDVSNVTEYEYCLSTTTICTTWLSAANTSFIKLTSLDYSTTYYWQVRATVGTLVIYADGVDAFWSFTTIAAAPEPLTISFHADPQNTHN